MTYKLTSLYTRITPDEYRRMPWKNGQGETLEIALVRDRNGIVFRLSQAAVVEDGAFSDFSGLHRTLVLLKGQGMLLNHISVDGYSYCHKLTSELDIARFSGGDRTHALLTLGPINDLNIMVRERQFTSKVTSITALQSFSFSMKSENIFSGFYACDVCELLIQRYTEDSELEKIEELNVSEKTTLEFECPVSITVKTGRGVIINVFHTAEL